MAIIDEQIQKDDDQINEVINEFDSNIDSLLPIILAGTGSLLVLDNVNIGITNNYIEQAIRQSGYYDTLNTMVNERYQMFIEDEIDLLDRILNKTVKFSDSAAEELMKYKEIDIQQFNQITQNIKTKMSTTLFQRLQGNLTDTQLREQLSKITEQYKHWTSAKADTSIAAFKQNASQAIAIDNGIEEFEYFGPLDSLTRQFCRNVLTGVYGENKKTIPEWNKLNNVSAREGQPDPVSVYRGGYRCRHRLAPARAA
jgi:hypothetical protein